MRIEVIPDLSVESASASSEQLPIESRLRSMKTLSVGQNGKSLLQFTIHKPGKNSNLLLTSGSHDQELCM